MLPIPSDSRRTKRLSRWTRQAVFDLMLAGTAKASEDSLESHPNPSIAKCDGPCALPLDKLEAFLSQAKAIDELVKGLDQVEVD